MRRCVVIQRLSRKCVQKKNTPIPVQTSEQNLQPNCHVISHRQLTRRARVRKTPLDMEEADEKGKRQEGTCWLPCKSGWHAWLPGWVRWRIISLQLAAATSARPEVFGIFFAFSLCKWRSYILRFSHQLRSNRKSRWKLGEEQEGEGGGEEGMLESRRSCWWGCARQDCVINRRQESSTASDESSEFNLASQVSLSPKM